MTNLNVEIDELAIDWLDEVTGGVPGCQCGGGGGGRNGTGPGTGGGSGHGGILWAGADGAGGASSIA